MTSDKVTHSAILIKLLLINITDTTQGSVGKHLYLALVVGHDFVHDLVKILTTEISENNNHSLR